MSAQLPAREAVRAAGHSQLSLLLGLLSTLGPYTIDAFFPSMRAIAHDFGITYFQAQQAITAYMLPYALVSMLHGSLSDALGRRRPVLVCLAVYAVASIGCALAPSFAALLAFRAVQGVVGGAGQIVGRAIVRDRYHGAEAQKLLSMITMIFSVGPAAAPVIGGWVHVLFGWRAVFGTMALLGAGLFLFALARLPETHPPERRTPLHVEVLLRNNWNILRHPEFLLLGMSTALCFVGLHVYVGSAPAIVMDHWHLNETQFAALTLPIIAGYTFGAARSGRMAGRMDPQRQALMGYRLLFAMTSLMLLLQLSGDAPVYLQQLLLAAIALGLQLMFPVVMLRILDLFPDSRGAAASMQSFFSLVLGTLTMGVVAPLLSRTMLRLAVGSLLSVSLGWLLYRLAQRYRAAVVPGS